MNINDYIKDILGTTTKIATWVKILAILLFMLCVWMCIHYLLYHYTEAHITSQPFDYNGMLVSFFTLLITLLVGWNIYSTINAKDELEKTRDKYESDIKHIKSDIEKLKEIQAEQKGAENERKQMSQNTNLSLPQDVLRNWTDKIQRETSNLYNWLFWTIDESKSIDDIFEEYKKIKKKSPSKILYINNRYATDEEIIALIEEIKPNRIRLIKLMRGDKN